MMLVFLVIRPLPREEEDDDEDEKGKPLVVVDCTRDRRVCPPEIVVVPTTEHQLSIGVLSFRGVQSEVLERSQKMSRRLHQLSHKIREMENRANKARVKAKIIQKIIHDELDIAAEVYQKNRDYMCIASKREVSKYAHQKYDSEFVAYYFPDLPQPMTAEEEAQIVSVDALDKELEYQRRKQARAKTRISAPVPSSKRAWSAAPGSAFAPVGQSDQTSCKMEHPNEAAARISIIHKVVQGQLDAAAVEYDSNRDHLCDVCKKEIKKYANMDALVRHLNIKRQALANAQSSPPVPSESSWMSAACSEDSKADKQWQF